MAALMVDPEPVVYVGPTVSPDAVRRFLPNANVVDPIQRGALYKDRERGSQVFLILDGTFYQDQAVSPREILDVIADGGLVVGASSMGALRAAECWPAGMIGIGTIYRAFRIGELDSDDEVIVTFASNRGNRHSSVALINVRYALTRARRAGILSPSACREVLQKARATFYSDRQWPQLLSGCSQEDRDRALEFLPRQDLKLVDACRALSRLAIWQRSGARSGHPRSEAGGFVTNQEQREASCEPFAGLDATPTTIRRFAQWQWASGRCHRHLVAVAAASDYPGLAKAIESHRDLAVLVDPAAGVDSRNAIALQITRQTLWSSAMQETSTFAQALWQELAVLGELDAELYRFRTATEAVAQVERRKLEPSPRDHLQARQEIATAHGHRDWQGFVHSLERLPARLQDAIWQYEGQLAAAKCLRHTLFETHSLAST